MKTPKV